MSYLSYLRKSKGFSERALAEKADLARETLRAAERDIGHAKPKHLEAIADVLGCRVLRALTPAESPVADLSTIAVSLAVVADGFATWKIHFMSFVDQFRRTPDVRLLLLPPTSRLDERLNALLASIVVSVAGEVELEAPEWARAERFLAKPWFPAATEALKAAAILESPLAFRRNNIFVLANFLRRA